MKEERECKGNVIGSDRCMVVQDSSVVGMAMARKVSCPVDSVDNREITLTESNTARGLSRYPSSAVRGVTNDYPRKER